MGRADAMSYTDATGHAETAAIEAFIRRDAETDLLRLTTAGSVDDGKSTLIGRLLYDSSGAYEDQIAAARRPSENGDAGAVDLALLTDGLRAEREQGITIDVAYRYFSTPRRKFIIADTPGHVQYTRNMATGASTANLAIILVDARLGVLPQSRRHAFIASLVGIQHIVVAVNKMDLVDYSEAAFESIRAEFTAYAARLQAPDLHFIPISALHGDNVVKKSARMPWFGDSSLLHYLETVHIASDRNMTEFRFPVQLAMRPDAQFRGYAGQVASGVVRPGDAVMALPSGRTTRVRSIVTYDGELSEAFPPMSVALVLEDPLDIGRGDMLAPPSHPPRVARKFDARMVWMRDEPLEPGRDYLLKHTTQTVRATESAVRYRVNIDSLEKEPSATLGLNDMGAVVVETRKPLFYDPYRRNRATGSFILIDPMSNATVAAGMITGREPGMTGREERLPKAPARHITAAEQQARAGHRAATVWLAAAETAYGLERALFDAGCRVHAFAAAAGAAEIARELNEAGVIALIYGAGDAELRERTREAVGRKSFVEDAPEGAGAALRLLEERGFLPGSGSPE